MGVAGTAQRSTGSSILIALSRSSYRALLCRFRKSRDDTSRGKFKPFPVIATNCDFFVLRRRLHLIEERDGGADLLNGALLVLGHGRAFLLRRSAVSQQRHISDCVRVVTRRLRSVQHYV